MHIIENTNEIYMKQEGTQMYLQKNCGSFDWFSSNRFFLYATGQCLSEHNPHVKIKLK